MVDSKKPDERIIFMLSPEGQGDGVPMLIIAIPKAAWEYMADTKTNTVDLTKAGLPIKVMIFGCDDRAHAMSIMEEWNAKAGLPTQYDDRDFGVQPIRCSRCGKNNRPNGCFLAGCPMIRK